VQNLTRDVCSKQDDRIFPQYLQVLQAQETKGKAWTGLSGKMAAIDANQLSRVKAIDEKVSNVISKQERMDTDMVDIAAKLETILQVVGANADASKSSGELD
jgi:uncharacterized membrane protein YdfJ with MMPL/SSD domain